MTGFPLFVVPEGSKCRPAVAKRSAMSSASFRFTLVDAAGAVSFVAPAYALKMIAAACAKGADQVGAVVEGLGEYDPTLAASLGEGLQRLAPDVPAADAAPDPGAPFRVMDEATRAMAQEPASVGLIVVNLVERRLVQVQNTYADLKRSDRGRMRRNGRPVQLLYRYELPEEWRIVP